MEISGSKWPRVGHEMDSGLLKFPLLKRVAKERSGNYGNVLSRANLAGNIRHFGPRGCLRRLTALDYSEVFVKFAQVEVKSSVLNLYIYIYI